MKKHLSEFSTQPIAQTQFNTLWKTIETVIGYSLLSVSPEGKSLYKIFHKYGLMVEYLHSKLSKSFIQFPIKEKNFR